MRTVFLALILTLTAAANAAPTGRVAGGDTAVALSAGFTDALASLGVEASLIAPARVRHGRVRFAIPAGAIDLETLAGDVFHKGGLSLSAGATTVDLFNFVIDTTATPVLTGLVVVNGDVVGRLPLFDLALTEGPTVSNWGRVRLNGVGLTLNATAADALNAVFAVDAFAEGFEIGDARVRTRLIDVLGADLNGGDDSDDSDDDDSDGDYEDSDSDSD